MGLLPAGLNFREAVAFDVQMLRSFRVGGVDQFSGREAIYDEHKRFLRGCNDLGYQKCQPIRHWPLRLGQQVQQQSRLG